MARALSSTSTIRTIRVQSEAVEFVKDWESLNGKIDPDLYADVRPRLQYQAGHSVVWRDAVVQYFLKRSGIQMTRGAQAIIRIDWKPRTARLTGYRVIDVNPWEDALGRQGRCFAISNPAQPSGNGTGRRPVQHCSPVF